MSAEFLNPRGKGTPAMQKNYLMYFVIGCSGAGKSTFLQEIKKRGGDKIGLVEVGKMMRAKYPPEYFKGSGSPAHTADEAWQMMCDVINGHVSAGTKVIFVDGQPRDQEQFTKIRKLFFFGEGLARAELLHIYTPLAVRLDRAWRIEDEGRRDLTLHRNVGPTCDQINTYEIISQAMSFGMKMTQIDAKNDLNFDNLFHQLVGFYV